IRTLAPSAGSLPPSQVAGADHGPLWTVRTIVGPASRGAARATRTELARPNPSSTRTARTAAALFSLLWAMVCITPSVGAITQAELARPGQYARRLFGKCKHGSATVRPRETLDQRGGLQVGRPEAGWKLVPQCTLIGRLSERHP